MTVPRIYRDLPEYEWQPYVDMWVSGAPSAAIRTRLKEERGIALHSHQLQDTMRRMGYSRDPATRPAPCPALLNETQERAIVEMWKRGDSHTIIMQFVQDEYGVSATEAWLRQRMARLRVRRTVRDFKLQWRQEHDDIVQREFAAGLRNDEIARMLVERGLPARAHDVAMRARWHLGLVRDQVTVHASPPPESLEAIALKRFYEFRFAGPQREDVVRKPAEKYRVPPGGYRLGISLQGSTT
jgi:transposase